MGLSQYSELGLDRTAIHQRTARGFKEIPTVGTEAGRRTQNLVRDHVRTHFRNRNHRTLKGTAIAIANTIAYISELIGPVALFLGLTRQQLMTQALRFFLFGEGETALLVYTILLRYWDYTPEEDVRPLIHLLSD